MTRRAYARRTDGNQREIVQAFRALGFQVLDLSKVGGGCADLAVRQGDGPVWFVEVKNPAGRNRIGEAQEAFARDWPVTVVRSVDDVARWAATAGVTITVERMG